MSIGSFMIYPASHRQRLNGNRVKDRKQRTEVKLQILTFYLVLLKKLRLLRFVFLFMAL